MLETARGLRVITGRELRELVPMADAIDAVREAFKDVSAGRMEHTPRTSLPDGSLLTMVAHGSRSSGTSVKVIGVRQNVHQDWPLLNALVLWFDHGSGRPMAVMEGSQLTALRTGAASGVATDLLAEPDAREMAMIGSGAQAADQILAVCTVRRIEATRIFSRNAETAARLSERLGHALPGVEFRVCLDLSSATKYADVICTATTATDPLIYAADLKERVHINAVGAYRPDMCEISSEVIAAASVVSVDEVDAAQAEAGDLLQAATAGEFAMERAVELGTLLTEPSAKAQGWTIFKSVGISAQDWAIARLAVERSEGKEVPNISLQ